jgi:hypothetical protein
MRLSWLLVPVLALLLPTAVEGDAPGCAPEAPWLSRDEYLRALSLDLRGVVPTMEEYESVAAMDDVPASLIDAWLASPEHAARVVRHHRDLLWPNLSNVRFVDFRRRLGSIGTDAACVEGYVGPDTCRRWYRSTSSTTLPVRGAAVACDDVPATFDEDGNVQFRTEVRDGTTVRIEGWVEVRPYWADPSAPPLRVCAFDAQERSVSPSGRACDTRDASTDPGCGCGPNLAWCDVQDVQNALVSSFAADVERRIAAAIEGGEPYATVFTGRRAFVNGPIVTYYRQLAGVYDSVPLTPLAVDVDALPDLGFRDSETWVEIELPAHHSGVLTSPLFLMRFQTLRARANRFYDAFLCEPFQPPSGGLPVAGEAESREADLQLRAGCRYCHAILEPAAAHWGRWMPQGAGFLDPASFPTFAPECAECARGEETCSATCSMAYLTRALSPSEEPYLGMLRAYAFLRPEHEANVDEGPAALVRDGLADGRFTECSVLTTSRWLLGRPLEPDEEAWSREVASAFVASFRYTDMERAIVTHETYRRVR